MTTNGTAALEQPTLTYSAQQLQYLFGYLVGCEAAYQSLIESGPDHWGDDLDRSLRGHLVDALKMGRTAALATLRDHAAEASDRTTATDLAQHLTQFLLGWPLEQLIAGTTATTSQLRDTPDDQATSSVDDEVAEPQLSNRALCQVVFRLQQTTSSLTEEQRQLRAQIARRPTKPSNDLAADLQALQDRRMEHIAADLAWLEAATKRINDELGRRSAEGAMIGRFGLPGPALTPAGGGDDGPAY